MPAIPRAPYTDIKTNWSIEIKDLLLAGRNKINPLKLNLQQSDRTCKYQGCIGTFLRTRTSGLCDTHLNHQHDLFLDVFLNGNHVSSPTHADIINHLITWAKSRNYDLMNFFKDCSFSILGNIPDVSTLSGDVIHAGFTPKSLDDYLDICIKCVDRHFPVDNNSSYQLLSVKGINFPARVLAIILVGLLLCEETNRGDRWFWREIVKQEEKTQFLGGAMPIAYFASMSFPWGMEIGKAAPKFVPSGR